MVLVAAAVAAHGQLEPSLPLVSSRLSSGQQGGHHSSAEPLSKRSPAPKTTTVFPPSKAMADYPQLRTAKILFLCPPQNHFSGMSRYLAAPFVS